MSNKILVSAALALLVGLTGCGGGGSDSAGSDNTGGSGNNNTGGSGGNTGGTATSPPPGSAKVDGPLDAVQGPVSEQVISPLAASFSGTPLQGVVQCVDQIVVTDTVDVLDVLALAIESGAGSADPDAALTQAAAGVQGQIENIVIDLNGMLYALDGNPNSCLGNVAPSGTNPLAGTPLEPVGAALAGALKQIYGDLHGSGSTRPQLPLSQVAGLVAQLEFHVNSAFAQVPADVASAPVVGAALSTVQAAVGNLADTVAAAANSDTAATQAALDTTLNGVLTGLLLNIVPVYEIENQAGQAGVLSGPIEDGIDQVSNEVSNNLGLVLQPVLEQNLDTALTPVLGVVDSTILPAILDPITAALDDAGVNVDEPLTPVIGVLDTFFSGVDGSPLDLVLDVVAGNSGCSLEDTVLSALCPATGLLPGL